MRKYILVILMALGCISASGQKVGLVLSGGGAKGLYHVGMIKALEENNIPIDYVTGTSMGSIVGAMYSVGYSPEEMMKFFISDSVQTWLSGKIPEQYTYFFKRFEPTPEMVSVNVNIGKDKQKTNVQLPVNIISPYRIDLAFMSMLQPASWAANENFDSLMVPFRCIASDVYNKKAITFQNGSLPFAVRASMTIPFVFTPLIYDTVLLYDGGLYDNFPVKAMMEDFKPDILIGGVCASNDQNPSQDDLIGQVMVMITNPTNYSLPDSMDILVKRKFKDVGTLEYNKAAYIMQKGYEDAMKQMPRILETIKRRVSNDQIRAKRAEFKAKIKPLLFEQITIEGLTQKQREFVFRQLGVEENQLFSPEYFEEKYMRILATGLFKGEFPKVEFNPVSGFYKLFLKMSTKPSLKLSLGGNISSTSLNQGYLAIDYLHITNLASNYYARGYFGTFFNSGLIGGRHDIYTQFPFYLEYRLGYENINYETPNMSAYYKNKDFRFLSSVNWFLNMSAATSVFNNWAAKAFLNLNANTSQYYTTLHTSQDRSDFSKFISGELGLDLQSRQTNFIQFSTHGYTRRFSVKYVMGLETFTPGTTSLLSKSTGKNRSWLEVRAFNEQDFYINKWFNLGYLVDVTFSTHPDFKTSVYTDYTAPTFAPTPHSATLFMPEFRSASYVGVGISPTFKFTKHNNFYLKTYAYGFVPQEIITTPGKDPMSWVRGIFGGSVVYQTPIGPASFTVTKYTTGPKNWAFVLGFGYAIFNAKKI